MLPRVLVLNIFPWLCCAGSVVGQLFSPLPDHRVADPAGRYYVVWKRVGGPEHFGEWGPTAFTVARQAPGTAAVTSARAYIENLDLYDSARGGQRYKMLENPEVSVRPGDTVLGRGTFEIPPRVVLVSSEGLGFVTLDLYGDNLPFIHSGRGGHAVVVVSPKGKLRHAKKLSDVFTGAEIRRFGTSAGSISWLRGGWINEDRQELVLVGGNDELRVVNLISGDVRNGRPRDIVRGLASKDPEAVKQALVMAAERRLSDALEGARAVFAHRQTRPDVRLRAAVTLAAMGDRRGAELIRKTAAGQFADAQSAQGWDRQFQRAVAIESLPEAIGPEALPLLVAALRNGRADASAAVKALVKLKGESAAALVPMVAVSQDRRIRLAAIGVLGSIGTDAKAAVPSLVAALGDDDRLVRIKAALALARCDPTRKDVLPILRAGLQYDVDEVSHCSIREAAAECLTRLGPEGTAIIVEALIEALDDEDTALRNGALEALIKVGPAAVPALMRGLRHGQARVRRGSALVLGKIRSAARPATAALLAALGDENPMVRGAAAEALCEIDPDSLAGVATLIELLERPEQTIRARAAVSLGRLGPRAGAAAGALAVALGDTDRVAAAAAFALGKIQATSAVPRLIEALGHKDRLVRRGAAESLGRLGRAATGAVDALIGLLEDEDWHVPHLAATALGRIGPEARAAIPALTAIVADERNDTQLRHSAAEALGRLGPEARAAIPALIETLSGESAHVAWQAAATLGVFGGQAVPGLIEAFSSESSDRKVRCRAADALGRIGPDARCAAEALIEALSDAQPATGFYSEEPLMRIGPVCVEHLIRALRSGDEDIRANAARILGRFGPEAKAAVDPLVAALKDKNEYVRCQAAHALAKIRTK